MGSGMVGGAEVSVCVVVWRGVGVVEAASEGASFLFGRRDSGSLSLIESTVGCIERVSG